MELADMPVTLDKQKALETYELMKLIRIFEEECASQYMRGLIRGFLHLYIGEEGVAVGAISALNENDYIVSHYRDHGHALARKLDPKAIMAELMGKSTGLSNAFNLKSIIHSGSFLIFEINLITFSFLMARTGLLFQYYLIVVKINLLYSQSIR